MDTDLVVRRGYYKVLKITDSHDCDYGPCKIYTISNGTDEPVEIGLYLNVPTDNPSGLLENPLDGTPRISIEMQEKVNTAEELVTWVLENPTADEVLLRAQCNKLSEGERDRLRRVMDLVGLCEKTP